MKLKSRNVTMWAFLMILLLTNCKKSDYFNQQAGLLTSQYNVSIDLKDKLVRSNDSTTLTLNIPGFLDSDFSFFWTCNIGNIKGDGDQATYYSPDLTGISTISVTIIDNDNNILTDSVDLKIYKQLILLKADDLQFDNQKTISDNWRTFIDYIKSNNLKASIGLIGNSLEYGDNKYYSYLKSLVASGNIELWNHGYNHLLSGINASGQLYHEFWNSPFDYQKQHLLKTEALAKDKLGITLHCFGAPGNNIDRNTLKALEEIPEINIWYFGFDDYSKLDLKRMAEIEFPTSFPDYNQFLGNYNAQKPYLVFQIHPNTWTDKSFSEFKKIINFLIQKDVTFINPSDYFGLLQKN